jgi:AcrR family transcriptional regulator
VSKSSAAEDASRPRGEGAPAPSPIQARIQQVAAELFAEKGYHATGIAEISLATGVGHGALYHHVKSKENLLYEISVALQGEALDRAIQIFRMDIRPEDKLYRLAHDLLQQLSEQRAGLAVSLYETRVLTMEHRAEVIRRRQEYVRLWEEVLAEGTRTGSLVPVSAIELRGLLGMLTTTYLELKPQDTDTPERIATEYIGMLLDGIRLRAERPPPARRRPL